MKKQIFISCSILLVAIVTISAVVVYQAYQILYEPFTHQLSVGIAFFDVKPEAIFQRYIMENHPPGPIPSEVTKIEGIQGSPRLHSGVQGPVFLCFDVNEEFVHQLIEQEYYYGSYAQISCDKFFDTREQQSYPTDFPELFEWWHPADVMNPTCYRLKSRYLLINNNANQVHFYRTFVQGSIGE